MTIAGDTQMFACGCTFYGWQNCNIHNASGPRCPFCQARALNFLPIWLPPVVVAAVAVVQLHRTRAQLARRRVDTKRVLCVLAKQALLWLVAAFLAITLVELLLGVAFIAATPEYGYFLGLGTTPPHYRGAQDTQT